MELHNSKWKFRKNKPVDELGGETLTDYMEFTETTETFFLSRYHWQSLLTAVYMHQLNMAGTDSSNRRMLTG